MGPSWQEFFEAATSPSATAPTATIQNRAGVVHPGVVHPDRRIQAGRERGLRAYQSAKRQREAAAPLRTLPPRSKGVDTLWDAASAKRIRTRASARPWLRIYGCAAGYYSDKNTSTWSGTTFHDFDERPGVGSRFLRGCFRAALQARDIRALVMHDGQREIASTADGSYGIILPESEEARALLADIKAGRLQAASVGLAQRGRGPLKAFQGAYSAVHEIEEADLIEVSLVDSPRCKAATLHWQLL